MRAVVLSDLHFGAEDPAALAAAEAFIAEFRPDLLMVAGDVSTTGRRREIEAAALWLTRMNVPIVATPGNHDVPYWNLFSRIAAPFRRFARLMGQSPAAPLEQAIVRPLETARGLQARLDWSLGRVSIPDVAAIAADFASANPVALRIVLAHHPLHPPTNADFRAATRRGPEAAQALAAAGTDLIISGHLHVPFLEPVPGGDGRTYALGSGTLSTRTRSVPPAFTVLSPVAPSALAVEVRACVNGKTEVFDRAIAQLRPPRLAAAP